MYARRHVRLGWWGLFTFALLGLILETFHGFKWRAYLDVSNETRRLMWTLAHAHGTGLSLINVVFGLYVGAAPFPVAARLPLVSRALMSATLLLPAGFFAGGVVFYAGDPGIGILLLPIGGALLLIALLLTALAAGSAIRPPTP